jgi:antitoxin component YwqK of YwqJK toxin-antitoxin module
MARTTQVRAIFSIKNNLPGGKAVFYNSDNTIHELGLYDEGVREGVWESFNYYYYSGSNISCGKIKTRYKKGIKNGETSTYSFYGKKKRREKKFKIEWNDSLHLRKTGQYTNGSPSGTWREYYGIDQINREYTYSDSISPISNVYDQMFPNHSRYDDEDTRGFHGKEIEYMSYGKNRRSVTILHDYGRVVYFDTLYRFWWQPEYILTKIEKNKPDSVALFELTHYYQNYKISNQNNTYITEVIQFRGGNRIKSTEYKSDGSKDEEYYYSEYYPQIKNGELYLYSIRYYDKSTSHEYKLKGFGKTFSIRLSKSGDTLSSFRIYNIDTTTLTYNRTKFETDEVTGISWREHLSGYPSYTERYTRNEEKTDSTTLYDNHGKRFTGNVYSINHRKANKHRLIQKKGQNILYYNRRLFSGMPFSYATYTEIKNGLANGKIIYTNNRYQSHKEITEYYMRNGEKHGPYTVRVNKETIDKDEREVARKHGIKSRKVNYTKTESYYSNGLPEGKQISRDATGVIRIESFYKNGSLEGAYITRHSNGAINEKSYYSNGKLTGKYERRNYLGNLMEESEYLDGNLNGYRKTYKSSGEPSFSIYAKNNILEGQAVLYNQIGLMEWKLDFDVRDSVPYDFPLSVSEGIAYTDRYFNWNNDNLVKKLQMRIKALPATFQYTEYFYTGKIAAEGKFENGRMKGLWKFYDLDGNLLHEVEFKPEEIELPHETLPVMGRIKSYYSNGKLKSTGYLEGFERNYDCKSRKNVYEFFIHFENYLDPEGKQTLINGNGSCMHYDEHGQKIMSGEYFEHMRNGFWKSWDKDGKLNSAGHYVNNLEDGIWWEGDLEGLSFVDNACFDIDSEEVQKEINRMKKNIRIKQMIYKNGMLIDSKLFKMDMNREKEYHKYKTRHMVNF